VDARAACRGRPALPQQMGSCRRLHHLFLVPRRRDRRADERALARGARFDGSLARGTTGRRRRTIVFDGLRTDLGSQYHVSRIYAVDVAARDPAALLRPVLGHPRCHDGDVAFSGATLDRRAARRPWTVGSMARGFAIFPTLDRSGNLHWAGRKVSISAPTRLDQVRYPISRRIRDVTRAAGGSSRP